MKSTGSRRVAAFTASLLMAIGVSACGSSNEAAPSQTGPAASATAQPADSDPTGGGTTKVVLLGDSLTAGHGLLETQAFPALLQNMADRDGYEVDIDNAGVSGDTSAGGLRRLDWALQGNVRIMVLALGANDGLRGLSVGEMKQNLTTIIERARARNIIVILAGMEAPPNYGGEYATAFRQAFRDVARENKTLLIPFLLDRVAGQTDLNQADGIHPNARGAHIMAETVWNVLRPVLDQLSGS